jgi:predicted XRE-type DNA-binding protein
LTPDQVAEIKRLLALRIYSQYHIAALFAVTQPTISHIAIGKCWSYIPPATAPLASTNPTKGN